MGKAKRKMRPQPPFWWTLDNDNCWFCKNRNNCGRCRILKRQRAEEKKKQNMKNREFKKMLVATMVGMEIFEFADEVKTN